MNEEQKLFLATKYREMPEKELLDMLQWNKNDYEDGVYDLVSNAVKERGLGVHKKSMSIVIND